VTTYLFVQDDGDFGALTFEQNYDPQTVYNEMVAVGVTHKYVVDPDVEGAGISVEIKTFGDVDPEFESFIFDKLVDYDAAKASNIYRVKAVTE